MALIVKNFINGEQITDPEVLRDTLDLDEGSEYLINHLKDFGEEHANDLIAPGIYLAMGLMITRVSEICTVFDLNRYFYRMLFLDRLGKWVFEFSKDPEKRRSQIHSQYKVMSDWLEKGWEYKTNLPNKEASLEVLLESLEEAGGSSEDIRLIRADMKKGGEALNNRTDKVFVAKHDGEFSDYVACSQELADIIAELSTQEAEGEEK